MAEVHFNIDHELKFAFACAEYQNEEISGPVTRSGLDGKWIWCWDGERVERSDLICVNYSLPEMSAPR